jgi:predicted dehydrogenase
MRGRGKGDGGRVRPVRVGVVGAGALGFHHIRLLKKIDGSDLVGFYDHNPLRSQFVAHELETTAFPSLEALLDRVEAITVVVPTSAHVDVGVAVLERGIHALIEKPLADTLPGAEQLVHTARQRELALQVGHVERFNRALRAAAPYLDEPRFLQTERLAPFQPRGTDVAVILDLMIHDLDLVLELVRSEVGEVRATGVPILTPHVDIANARVEFANGAVAIITASRVSRERTRKLRIFQHTGYFSLDLAQGNGHFYRLKSGWQGFGATRIEEIVEHVRLDAPEAEPLQLELESFLRAVRGDGDVVVTGAAGLQALTLAYRVADAIDSSPLASARP